MLQKPTDELNDILENTKPGELGTYLKENEKYLADEKKAFYYYFKDVLDEKSIKLNEVYLSADVSESYLNIDIDGFLTFADFFFDGIIADYLVQSKIRDARSQVEEAIEQVSRILDSLRSMR